MIDESLINDFIPEALDQLEILESNIILLEAHQKDEEVISNIFRAAHTIKGSSEYIGLKKIATIAHKLENLLDMVRHGEIIPDSKMINLLIKLHDCMASLTRDLQEHRKEKTAIKDLVAKTDEFCAGAQKAKLRNAVYGPEDEMETPDFESEEAQITNDIEDEDDFSLLEKEIQNHDPDDISKQLILDDENDSEKQDDEMEDDELNDFEKSLSDELNGFSTEPVKSKTDDIESEDKKALVRLKTAVAFEEEYDEELFKIFLDHLQENLHQMLTVLSKGNDNNPETILHQCVDIVTSLRSSAAYMDYAEVVIFYDAWSSQIQSVIKKADNGLPVSFTFITDYMDQMIHHFSLSEKFDSLWADAAIKPGENEPEEDLAGFERADEPVEGDIVLEEMSAEATVSPTLSPVDDLTDEDPAESAGTEIVPQIQDSISLQTHQPSETQGLFDELDTVFDTSSIVQKSEDIHIDPFDADIEDELSALPTSGGPVNKSAPKPPKKVREKEAAVQESAMSKPAEKVTEEKSAPQPKTPLIEKIVPPVPVKAVQPEEKKPAEKKLAEKKLEKAVEKTIAPVEKEAEPTRKPVIAAAEKYEPTDDDQSGKMIYDEHSTGRLSKQTLRVAADKIDKLMNQVGELVVNRASYAQLYNEMREFQRQIRNMGLDVKESKWIRDFTFRLSEATVALGRVANDLQEGVMKIRMLPIAQLFNRYPRLVRDLVHNTNKQVQLDIQGEETELDKMVIEEIADPLVHIIRNAVDHGIETVNERIQKNKPPTATVRLEAYHESNHVVIEIIDDGKGINLQLIRNVAVEKGLFTRDEVDRMRQKEVISIIMMPGFSTSEKVTTTSGRGVGMDVVKKNVEKLNGTIEIDSEIDEGTRIRIKIPLTLAIIQALLIRLGGEVFTIPLSVVEETLRVPVNEINTIEGIEVIQLRDRVLSLLRLTDEFKKESKAQDKDHEYVVVVNTGMRQVGLVVDSLIGQEEAVIKPLVDFLQERSGFSGATILGDGSVSLILDVYELVNICMERQASLKHSGSGFMEFSTNKANKHNSGSQEVVVH